MPKSIEPGVDFRLQFHTAGAKWKKLRPVIPPVKNQIFNKPVGGFWTSTFTPFKPEVSAWVEWCLSECSDFVTEWNYILEVLPTARIFTIDLHEDLMYLIEKYGWVTYKTYNPASYLFDDRYPDFEKISKDFDGLHISEKGQRRTRMTKPGLYGWDCESTLWFRDVFGKIYPYNGELSIREPEVSDW